MVEMLADLEPAVVDTTDALLLHLHPAHGKLIKTHLRGSYISYLVTYISTYTYCAFVYLLLLVQCTVCTATVIFQLLPHMLDSAVKNKRSNIIRT